MTRTKASQLILTTALLAGCADEPENKDPTQVTLGETTFVVVVNPSINDLNDRTVPQPGAVRDGVTATARPISATTGPLGIAVLRAVDAGNVDLTLSGQGIDGVVATSIQARDLVEIAVAADDDGVAEMIRIVYRFGGEVIELHSDDPIDAVNDALSGSDRIVLLDGGVYSGNLEFSGSNVTLFGAGASGGEVTIVGDVTVSGSGNRIRGTRIEGDVDLSGSDAGISFSTIDGQVQVSGSDSVLLESVFCGAVDISGSGTTVLGNRGLDGDDEPPECT
jgi:hypothetical protein